MLLHGQGKEGGKDSVLLHYTTQNKQSNVFAGKGVLSSLFCGNLNISAFPPL